MIAYEVWPSAKNGSLDDQDFLDELETVDHNARGSAHPQGVDGSVHFGQVGKHSERRITVTKLGKIANHRKWSRPRGQVGQLIW